MSESGDILCALQCSQNATKLMSQLFHEKSVMEIKCRTLDGGSGGGRRLTSSDDVDEVTILYEDGLVVLDGFSLFQTLRACRSQVALGKTYTYYALHKFYKFIIFMNCFRKICFTLYFTF